MSCSDESMRAAAQQLEAATTAFYTSGDARVRSDAERFIQEFQRRNQPYELCKLVLLSDATQYTKFTAVSTWRIALLREWSMLESVSVAQMRDFLLSFTVSRSSTLERVVRNQLWSLIAVILKKQWMLDESGSSDFLLNFLSTSVCSTSNLECISSLLTEFSARTASTTGLSWEQQVISHRSFEKLALKRIFVLLLNLLQSSLQKQASGKNESGICMSNLVAILEWDFDEKLSNDKLNFLSIDPNAINAETAIRPGSAWRDLLTSSNFVQFVMSLQQIFIGDAKFLRLFIKLMTQMASLSGTIFADKAAELLYMLQISSGVRSVSESFRMRISAADDEDHLIELLGDECFELCQLIQRFISTFNSFLLIKDAPVHHPHIVSLFEELSAFTTILVDNIKFVNDSRIAESLDILLEAWNSLSVQHLRAKQQMHLVAELDESFSRNCHNLFSRFIQQYINNQGAEDYIECGASFDSSQLNHICLVGRSTAQTTIPWLCAAIDQSVSELVQHIVTSTQSAAVNSIAIRRFSDDIQTQFSSCFRQNTLKSSLNSVISKLLVFIQVAAFLMVDVPDDQLDFTLSPRIPASMILASLQTFKSHPVNSAMDLVASADPLFLITQSVFRIVSLEQLILTQICIPRQETEIFVELLDPELSHALSSFFAQWAPAYLMLSPSTYDLISPAVLHVFGDGQPIALNCLSTLINRTRLLLFEYPKVAPSSKEHSVDLAAMLCRLSKSSQFPSLLMKIPAWVDFTQACVACDSQHRSLLAASAQSLLFESMVVISCECSSDSDALRAEKFNLVTQSSVNRLKKTLDGINSGNVADFWSLFHQLNDELFHFRGLSRASGSRTLKLKFPLIVSLLEILPSMFKTITLIPNVNALNAAQCSVVQSVIHRIIYLFHDTAAADIAYLDSEQSLAFLRVCVELVRSFAAISSQLSGSTLMTTNAVSDELDEEAEDVDQDSNFILVMKLLQHIASKAAVNFSDESTPFVSEAVLAALFLIAPQIQPERVQLMESYFDLVHDFLLTSPHNFLALAQDQQDIVSSSLLIGLTQPSSGVLISTLKSVFQLCSIHRSAKSNTASPAFQSLNASILKFQQALLQMMLVEKFNDTVVDPLADAFLSVFGCNSEHMSVLISSILGQQSGDAILLARLQGSFQSLLNSGEVDVLSIERKNRFKFRRLLRQFLQSTRGLLSRH